MARRGRERVFDVIARSGATKQSILSLRGAMDCFASLAMTITAPYPICHRPRRRAIQYSEASMMESKSCGVLDIPLARGMTVLGGAGVTFFPGCRGACHRARFRATRWLAMTRRQWSGIGSIRSASLTIFWRCDHPRFSFRKGRSAGSGNEPSMVLAENALSKGSGNADSQRKVRSSGWSGVCRPSRRDSGCVLAHPASWRASASYRPLRAVWAVCAWALRGCARSPDPFSAQRAAHQPKEFSDDHR
jgi:hypothetical protein